MFAVKAAPQVFVDGLRVTNLKLHGLYQANPIPYSKCAGMWIGADQPTHEEVAAFEVLLVLVDDVPQQQRGSRQFLVAGGKIR